VKSAFEDALSTGLVARGFERSDTHPAFLLY